MSDKEDTNDKTAQDAPLTDEETESVQGGRLADPSASSAAMASEGALLAEEG
ncbi:MAG: hypothetical protein U0904_03920 [Candidatus Nanopelagicales bacterium]|nr:hypothetical protein [Candidatus Nanopelagicales bacterium]